MIQSGLHALEFLSILDWLDQAWVWKKGGQGSCPAQPLLASLGSTQVSVSLLLVFESTLSAHRENESGCPFHLVGGMVGFSLPNSLSKL